MLVYLASEDPEKIARDRIDMAARADSIVSASASPPATPPIRTWPACTPAPRTTRPRF
jgi:hypothetical protein